MAIKKTISKKISPSSTDTENDKLRQLLEIAQKAGIAPPEQKLTLLEKLV